MAAIIVSVLPKPITSANTPPIAMDGMTFADLRFRVRLVSSMNYSLGINSRDMGIEP